MIFALIQTFTILSSYVMTQLTPNKHIVDRGFPSPADAKAYQIDMLESSIPLVRKVVLAKFKKEVIHCFVFSTELSDEQRGASPAPAPALLLVQLGDVAWNHFLVTRTKLFNRGLATNIQVDWLHWLVSR